MAETAFSKQFNREVDPEQYIQLLPANIDIHSVTRMDIICPVCKVGGASYVSGTTGQKARKAHFRFTSATGDSAHHPLCDFYDDKLSNEIGDKLIQFSKDRTHISAVVRHRVCAGIQEGLFSQRDIWDMRAWFFEMRSKFSIQVKLPEQNVKWLHQLLQFWRSNIGIAGSYSFHPAQANMPGFKWKRAVVTEFYRINKHIYEQLIELNRHSYIFGSLDEIVQLIDKGHLPNTVVDPEAMRAARNVTAQLTSFITQNDPELKNFDKAPPNRNVMSKFSAFAALLLFTSDWNFNVAVEKYARLVRIQQVDDMLAGNIIGLDIFKDCNRSEALLTLQKDEVMQISSIQITVQEVEQEMRNEYLKYSQNHTMPPLLPPVF